MFHISPCPKEENKDISFFSENDLGGNLFLIKVDFDQEWVKC